MSTEQEPNKSPDVIADHFNELQQIELEGYELAVRKARNALFWTAGLILFWELFSMYRAINDFDPTIVIFAFVTAGIFAGLGFWTKKKPYTALVTGLAAFIFYILLVVTLNGLVNGAAGVAAGLFSGIIVKVVILVNLIRPLKDAKALQQARENRF